MLILGISVCVKLKLGDQMPDQMRLRRVKRPDLGVLSSLKAQRGNTWTGACLEFFVLLELFRFHGDTQQMVDTAQFV